MTHSVECQPNALGRIVLTELLLESELVALRQLAELLIDRQPRCSSSPPTCGSISDASTLRAALHLIACRQLAELLNAFAVTQLTRELHYQMGRCHRANLGAGLHPSRHHCLCTTATGTSGLHRADCLLDRNVLASSLASWAQFSVHLGQSGPVLILIEKHHVWRSPR